MTSSLRNVHGLIVEYPETIQSGLGIKGGDTPICVCCGFLRGDRVSTPRSRWASTRALSPKLTTTCATSALPESSLGTSRKACSTYSLLKSNLGGSLMGTVNYTRIRDRKLLLYLNLYFDCLHNSLCNTEKSNLPPPPTPPPLKLPPPAAVVS